MPTVDIAIPCYEYGRFLRDCVASIQSQGIADFRILIIDNASTDNSVEVARALALEDPRIDVVAHPRNLGAHASYNEAIDWAASEYFLLLDADDFLMPGCLARAINVMEKHPNVAITHGRLAHLTPRGLQMDHPQPDVPAWKIVDGITYIKQLCEFSVSMDSAPTAIRRTAAQKRAGYYRTDLPYTDDIELWMRIALQGDVACTDAIQAVRRVHPQQATTYFRDNPVNDLREQEAAFYSFFAHEGQHLTDCDTLLKSALRNIEDRAYWSGISHVLRGYRREGLDLLRYANRSAPLGLRPPPLDVLWAQEGVIKRVVKILAQLSFTRQERPGLHERS